MAGVKKCLGVDIGSDTVKIAELALDKGGVRVIRMVSAPLGVGPTALDAERTEATVTAIRNLIKTNKISTKNAVFSIPGQTVVVRHGLRLPKASGPRFQQIIQFESRNQIPFPLEQSLIEYQSFDTADPREVEILLVGMKKDTNKDFMKLVRRLGLKPTAIVPSHLALFNGLEFPRFLNTALQAGAQGKKKAAKPLFGLSRLAGIKGGKKKKGEAEAPAGEEAIADQPSEDLAGLEGIESSEAQGFEEVRAYVNIGAKTTDLAISEPSGKKNVGFTRAIPIGSAHISAQILKACHCENFADADKIKLDKTAVLSGMFELEGDTEKYDRKACEAATAVCDRIIAELRRSMDYFISQPYGMAVDTVVLSGSGASLPFLDTYLEERLGMPVELANTLESDKIKAPSQYSEGFNYLPYRVALGLSAQGLGVAPIGIDFLPPDIRAMRDFGSQGVEIAGMAAIIGAMIFFGSQIGQKSMNSYRANIATYDQMITELQPIQKEKQEIEAAREAIKSKIGVVATLFEPRDFWLRFQADLQRVKPPEILVSSIVPNADYNNPLQWAVEIAGQAEQSNAVTTFVNRLKENSKYVKSAQLSRNSMQFSNQFQKNAWQFRIQAEVQDADTTTGLLTRLMPEMTPKPAEGAPGMMGMFPGMEGMTPEQLREMMMMMGPGMMMPGMMPPGMMPPGMGPDGAAPAQ